MFISRDVCNLIFYDLQGIYPVVKEISMISLRWYIQTCLKKYSNTFVKRPFLQCLRKFQWKHISGFDTYCFVLCIPSVNVLFTIMLHEIGLNILYFKMTYTLLRNYDTCSRYDRLMKDMPHFSVTYH